MHARPASIGVEPDANPCEGMEGLIPEGEDVIAMGLDSAAQDAGLIAAARKVEHDEIALHGTLRTFAGQLGHDKALSLQEEKATD